MDFALFFDLRDLVTVLALWAFWDASSLDESCATPGPVAHSRSLGSDSGSPPLQAISCGLQPCWLFGIRAFDNTPDARHCVGPEGRKRDSSCICAFWFVLPLPLSSRGQIITPIAGGWKKTVRRRERIYMWISWKKMQAGKPACSCRRF